MNPTQTKNTVKIYLVTCAKAYSMSEQGSGFSLHPWGSNTDYYEGYDDGGKEYILPEGFRVGMSVGEGLQIYREQECCSLVTHSSGRPQIVTLRHGWPVLEPA